MASRLEEVLQGEEANYILPFMWQRGEEEAVIREEMARIHASGIKAVCVEARPHPDFLGPQWWRDMDVIMEEARNRGMRVWVFDDDHFPTGHAVGKIEKAPAELRRVFLQERHIDAIGPQNNASFLVTPWFSDPFRSSPAEGKTLVAAVAATRDSASDALTGGFVDLTSRVEDDVLYWDIPEGLWRIFLLIASPTGGSERHKDYVNYLVAESVRVLINTVYEAFYERYRDDFGHTFAGFFSDEPGFYNDSETFDYQSKLGKKGVDLPWCADLLQRLEGAFGQDCRKYLPLLWHDGGEFTRAVRYTYMDVVSRLYADNFTQQIGDWCRSHQVEYIGHVLEDNGVHTRLGCGAGHYFRALWGQDMSGLDVVLWQLVPGFDAGPFASVAGDADGEFYHYGLAKLGSSLAHVDRKKRGRAMCEVFGAYGWREGLKLMKWLTDHMLVRGINHFIPHAFSQAEFPDRDCPPHMYARGKNPQYRYYRELNRYTNRVSHLLSGGRHIASAAVLYHAEAEWSGAWMPFHKPVKALMQSQIDCDVLPGDILIGAATVADGKLLVEAESFDCLIVPYSEALPSALLSRLVELAEQGLPLLFVDGLPTRSSEGRGAGDALVRLSTLGGVQSVPLGKVAHLVKEMGFYEIEVEGGQPHLRYFHVEHPDLHVYMFFNEHPYDSVETTVRLPARGRALVYDAFNNRLSGLNCTEEQGDMRFSLHLSPYESTIVVMGEQMQGIPVDNQYGTRSKQAPKALVVEGPWSIAAATADRYPSFDTLADAEGLSDMSLPDALPAFSGTFRYQTEFEWTYSAETVTLDLGELYETVEVWVNGQSAGVRICPPYCLDIGELVHPGNNALVIEVTNTLANEQRDFFSRFAQQEPSGLLGPVRLLF